MTRSLLIRKSKFLPNDRLFPEGVKSDAEISRQISGHSRFAQLYSKSTDCWANSLGGRKRPLALAIPGKLSVARVPAGVVPIVTLVLATVERQLETNRENLRSWQTISLTLTDFYSRTQAYAGGWLQIIAGVPKNVKENAPRTRPSHPKPRGADRDFVPANIGRQTIVRNN